MVNVANVDMKTKTENLKKTHYKQTPYSYQRDLVKKLTNNPHIDLGEGLIQIIESLDDKH